MDSARTGAGHLGDGLDSGRGPRRLVARRLGHREWPHRSPALDAGRYRSKKTRQSNRLEHDVTRRNHHHALAFCLPMTFRKTGPHPSGRGPRACRSQSYSRAPVPVHRNGGSRCRQALVALCGDFLGTHCTRCEPLIRLLKRITHVDEIRRPEPEQGAQVCSPCT
jgi:hypothetical protein